MEAAGNETLDRIQQEIQESLDREEELRRKYNSINNNVPVGQVNGFSAAPSPEPRPPLTNGSAKSAPTKGGRLFASNGTSSTKGMMQKFLRMRGKLNMVSLKPQAEPQRAWAMETATDPARVIVEAGRNIRNGFIPAEEKMRRELVEFQEREEELRKERRKSQPDLMAALENEQEEITNLRAARSMATLRSSEDLTDNGSSTPTSLKPARSLADLCDATDEELETRGTHSLIMRFERMKSQP